MSLFYRFKPQKDRSLRSVTTHLDGAGITANEVTALGLCLALGAGRLAYYGHLYTGLILFAAGSCAMHSMVPLHESPQWERNLDCTLMA